MEQKEKKCIIMGFWNNLKMQKRALKCYKTMRNSTFNQGVRSSSLRWVTTKNPTTIQVVGFLL